MLVAPQLLALAGAGALACHGGVRQHLLARAAPPRAALPHAAAPPPTCIADAPLARIAGAPLPRVAAAPLMQAAVETSPDDDARLCTVCVALLGQYRQIDEMIEAVPSPVPQQLDVGAFAELVDSLEVQCSEADKRAIFTMIDRDGSGSICASELRQALRSSGAIKSMYDGSLRTFGTLIAATLAFDVGVFALKGSTAALDFLTAYAVEDSLSVDNLFVFLLIFRTFKVPPQTVDACLNYGIAGSIVLRGVFIFAGLAAVSAFNPLLLGFSAFLLFSSYQLLTGDDDDDDLELPQLVVDLLERLPMTNTFEGNQLYVKKDDGGVEFTQLTATLVSIALCDVLFAIDSIPAVLGVSDDPFVVYTSNIAAVVGLRSLYQLLSVAVSDLVYLESAVALVLGFVGLKLGVEVLGVEVSSMESLGVILATLGGGVALSLASDAEIEPPQPKGLFLMLATKWGELREAARSMRGR